MNERRERAPYLKLVATQKKKKVVKKASKSPQRAPRKRRVRQLSLLYADDSSVIAANVVEMQVAEFRELVFSVGPKWVVDTRVAPRLDQLAGDRGRALKLFHDVGSEYLDIGLETYRTTDANPAYWAHEIGQVILSSGKPRGPFLVLFDNTSLMDASFDEIAEAFDKVLGVKISVSIVA